MINYFRTIKTYTTIPHEYHTISIYLTPSPPWHPDQLDTMAQIYGTLYQNHLNHPHPTSLQFNHLFMSLKTQWKHTYYQNTHHNLILSNELLLDSSYVWLCCFIVNFLRYSKITLCDGLRAPILLVSFPPYLPSFSFSPRSCFTSETFSFFLFFMALHHVIYCSSWTFFLWADIISSSAYRCQPLCMLCILISLFIYYTCTCIYAEKPNKFKFKFKFKHSD